MLSCTDDLAQTEGERWSSNTDNNPGPKRCVQWNSVQYMTLMKSKGCLETRNSCQRSVTILWDLGIND